MRYTYEISNLNEISVWDNENPNQLNLPFFFQPDWPNRTAWANRQQAQDWANLFVESLLNFESQYLPGDSPDSPKKIRPPLTRTEEN